MVEEPFPGSRTRVVEVEPSVGEEGYADLLSGCPSSKSFGESGARPPGQRADHLLELLQTE